MVLIYNVPEENNNRDFWVTKYGLILAMAGNAIGLGNFLRFPVQAAENGGGAFLLPYIICFICIGIPLMWIEWGIGRHGGSIGKGPTYGIYTKFNSNKVLQIASLLGIWIPLIISIYYIYIESWTLGYSLKSLFGELQSDISATTEKMSFFKNIFSEYTGNFNQTNSFLIPSVFAYGCFLLTLLINYGILYRGISRGIEKFVKFAMPALFFMSLFMVVYVFTIKTSISSAIEGFDFLWSPDFSSLTNPKVWIAAAGQVFFTLSLGFGAIVTYASFIKKDEDIALSGLTSASLNELIEVVFGGSIVIPAAVAFLGVAGAVLIAQSGAFTIGFIAMPAIFDGLPLGGTIGFIWFFLLFIAGLTSSIGILQPVITFVKEEFALSQKKSSLIVILVIFFFANFVIFVPEILEEFDFWAGTILLVVLALVEIAIYVIYISPKSHIDEINRSSLIKIPKIYNKIFKYFLPLFLIILIFAWVIQDINSANSMIFKVSFWSKLARILLLSIFLGIFGLVFKKVFNK